MDLLGYFFNAFAGITLGLTMAVADLPATCTSSTYKQPHYKLEVADKSFTIPLESLLQTQKPLQACLDTSGWMTAPVPLLPPQMLAPSRI
jgi:hypothetical protein